MRAGNRIQISGMRNNKSGIIRVTIDDQQPYEGDLFLDDIQCSLFVDYYLGNGTHNMTVELVGKSENATEAGTITPVVHLTDIVCVVRLVAHALDLTFERRYWIPGLPDDYPSSTPTPVTAGGISSPPSSSSTSHVGAIVGGVVGGVAALAVVALGLFYFFKRRMLWPTKRTISVLVSHSLF